MQSLCRTLVTQLIEHERIQTTLGRAKELRKLADRVVTYAKKVAGGIKGTAGALELAGCSVPAAMGG
jgi:ribosomal protein L17